MCICDVDLYTSTLPVHPLYVDVFRLCTCLTKFRDIQCTIPTHPLCVLNLLEKHSHLWYMHHLLLASAHSVYICIYC